MTARVQFTQFMRPRGRREAVWIDLELDDDFQHLVNDLAARGVKFEIEELQTGHVSMEAVGPEDEHGDPIVYAHEICANGPDVPDRVEKLVREAHKAAHEGPVN